MFQEVEILRDNLEQTFCINVYMLLFGSCKLLCKCVRVVARLSSRAEHTDGCEMRDAGEMVYEMAATGRSWKTSETR